MRDSRPLICSFGDVGISPKRPYNVRLRIKAMADFSLGATGKVVVPTHSELDCFDCGGCVESVSPSYTETNSCSILILNCRLT
jgi:hypothetical protein